MALASGTRIGPYEILSPLGAGGMGEVYRATDTKLGRDEVYVVPFPSREGKWQISSSGGGSPFWSSNGTELDYFTPDRKWMVVEVNGKGSDFAIGATRTLFGGKAVPVNSVLGLGVTPDLKKLLLLLEGEKASVPFTIVTNWREQLKK